MKFVVTFVILMLYIAVTKDFADHTAARVIKAIIGFCSMLAWLLAIAAINNHNKNQ